MFNQFFFSYFWIQATFLSIWSKLFKVCQYWEYTIEWKECSPREATRAATSASLAATDWWSCALALPASSTFLRYISMHSLSVSASMRSLSALLSPISSQICCDSEKGKNMNLSWDHTSISQKWIGKFLSIQQMYRSFFIHTSTNYSICE